MHVNISAWLGSQQWLQLWIRNSVFYMQTEAYYAMKQEAERRWKKNVWSAGSVGKHSHPAVMWNGSDTWRRFCGINITKSAGNLNTWAWRCQEMSWSPGLYSCTFIPCFMLCLRIHVSRYEHVPWSYVTGYENFSFLQEGPGSYNRVTVDNNLWEACLAPILRRHAGILSSQ